MRPILFLAVAVLALTGCAATPVPKVTPTATSSSGTVRQFASVIAEQKASINKWQAQWDADQCSGTDGSTMPCGMELLGGAMIASTASLSLGTAANTSQPPKEIRDLYTATAGLADDAAAAGKAWQDSCNAAQQAECAGLVGRMEIAMGMLGSKLEAWTPYL